MRASLTGEGDDTRDRSERRARARQKFCTNETVLRAERSRATAARLEESFEL